MPIHAENKEEERWYGHNDMMLSESIVEGNLETPLIFTDIKIYVKPYLEKDMQTPASLTL